MIWFIIPALIIIPPIINVYVFAWDLKKNHKYESVTIADVLDSVDAPYLFFIPAVSLFICILAIIAFTFEITKDTKIL